MLVVCKKCNVEHDARDVNNGVCVWCEQKENTESISLQFVQKYAWNKYHPVFTYNLNKK